MIVVDQFGYLTKAPKFAVIRQPQTGYDSFVHFVPGRKYAVVDKATGKIFKSGSPTAWNGGITDSVSGDKAWWFDFSDVITPGTYTVVDIDRGLRSVEFEIDDHVYRSVLKHAMRMFYYQRAGFAKTSATAGSAWADGASHMGPNQDPQTHSWLNKSNVNQIRICTVVGTTPATTINIQAGRLETPSWCSALMTNTQTHLMTIVA